MDIIDIAQRRQQEEIDHALAARPSMTAGRTHCKIADCRAPISPQRQRLGAELCMDCQRAFEHRARSRLRRVI